MAIGDSYLTSIRQYMRITSTAFDPELKDLINAARADLVLGGVLEVKAQDETDPLILRAVARAPHPLAPSCSSCSAWAARR